MIDWDPLFLSLKLATVNTVCLFLVTIPLAYWLAYTPRRWKSVVEIVVCLPLVLPPTVLGFYLLIFLGPHGPLGSLLERWVDIRLVFTFPGLVIGSMVFCLPFMAQSLRSGFESVPRSLKEASATLGRSPLETLLRVLLPNMKPALVSASLLTFGHTLGEFGVVLMIGGNIPGTTRVASLAVYEEVEALNYAAAHRYSLVLLALGAALLAIVYAVNRKAFSQPVAVH